MPDDFIEGPVMLGIWPQGEAAPVAIGLAWSPGVGGKAWPGCIPAMGENAIGMAPPVGVIPAIGDACPPICIPAMDAYGEMPDMRPGEGMGMLPMGATCGGAIISGVILSVGRTCGGCCSAVAVAGAAPAVVCIPANRLASPAAGALDADSGSHASAQGQATVDR